MGCRIIVGNQEDRNGVECAVFFDSTRMVAFGPVMGSAEEAEAFMQWLTDQGESEPRDQTENELRGFHAKFAQEMVCECGEVRDTDCEYCADQLPFGAIFPDRRMHEWDEHGEHYTAQCTADPAPQPGERFECSGCRHARAKKAESRQRAALARKAAE